MAFIANVHIACATNSDCRLLHRRLSKVRTTSCYPYSIDEQQLRGIERAYGDPKVMKIAWPSRDVYYTLQVIMVAKTENAIFNRIGDALDRVDHIQTGLRIKVPTERTRIRTGTSSALLLLYHQCSNAGHRQGAKAIEPRTEGQC